MTDTAPAPVPLHVRSIEYTALDGGDTLAITGRLRDTRPWATGTGAVERVHDMELRVTVAVDGLLITEADAVMHTFPHTECPAILDAFRGLAGLSVARGYTRRVQALFGGPAGCTHLEHLARSLGPVVIQALTSKRAQAVARGDLEDLVTGSSSPWALDSCHVWAEGGVAVRKLAAGWRPGIGPYPALAVEAYEAGDIR